jgi:hypothetical protein
METKPMKRTGLQRGRLLAVVISAIGLACLSGVAAGDIIVIDDFEFYESTDDLRSTWKYLTDSTNIHLECGEEWCCTGGDNWDQGPAWDGCQYMRISILAGTQTTRCNLGPVDWTGTETVALYYRPRNQFENGGTASLQVILRASNGAPDVEGPVLLNAHQCDYFVYGPICPWFLYELDVTGWAGFS